MSTESPLDLPIREVMRSCSDIAVAGPTEILKTALDKMVEHNLGIACVVGDDFRLLGVITDGDLRRRLLTAQRPLASIFMDNVGDYLVGQPVTIAPNGTFAEALKLSSERQVWDLPVVENDCLIGLFHLNSATKFLI